jgi:regulator of sigma E protease
MSIGRIVIAIFGLVLLMIVHEFGHYFAARRFGMRVETFSLGFGPTIWKHKPKDSPTTFQIAVLPFLAYVKIAGMNPFEPFDADDRGSYANASLWGRIVTIAAGPLANYAFAFLLFLSSALVDGRLTQDLESMRIKPRSGGPAAVSGVQEGDRVVRINGKQIADWRALQTTVSGQAGKTLDVEVERAGTTILLHPVVGADGDAKGKILIEPITRTMAYGETVWMAAKKPPMFIYENVRAIGLALTFRETPQVGGPVRMVKEISEAIRFGLATTLGFLGVISSGLVAINLLPIPALDGGRLMFLFYEAIARKRANEQVEAKIHGVALLMFLALFFVITIHDFMPDKKEDAPAATPASLPNAPSAPSTKVPPAPVPT